MGFIPTVNGSGGFTATVNGQSALLAGMSTVGIKGDTGPAGANGSPGVVAATAPITYTAGTQTVGMDTSYFLRSPAAAGTDGQIVSWDAATSRPLWIDNAARTLFATVRNETGATLTKGTVVYISGASGNKPLVSKAQANTDANSAQTFAVISADLPTNQNGTAIVAGELTKLDTSAYAEGAALYLSPTTAGAFTTTKPSAPNHLVYVATVVRSHQNQGVIEVRIQNGYELEELHNVAINGVADKNILAYDSATSLWKNRTASALDLATMTWASATFAPAGWNPFDQTLNTNSDPQFTSVRVGALIVKPVGQTPIYPTDYQFEAYKPDLVLLKADNLSGLDNATARTNLGLGTMAVETASNYLTTATASTTYQTQAGMSAYLTTSSASSTYLTQSNAASTYQTISGMSSYLTTSTAASTYLTQSSAASTYQTQAGMSSYALLASPTFTGDPKAPTPATSDNDTSIATTAFVNTYCPTASTSTAGKVQLATDAQAQAGTSTSLGLTPKAYTEALVARNWHIYYPADFTTASSGTGGTNGTFQSGSGRFVYGPTSSGVGYISAACFCPPRTGSPNNRGFDWSKPLWFSFKALKGAGTSASSTFRCIAGGVDTVYGDPTSRSIGVRVSGSSAAELIVHDGTTLTAVASSYTFTTDCAEIELYSNGSGTVTMYVNGSSVATTSSGPTAIESAVNARQVVMQVTNDSGFTSGQQQFLVWMPITKTLDR